MEDESKIISILTIGFITLLILLLLNMYKVNRLKKENNKLKQTIKK